MAKQQDTLSLLLSLLVAGAILGGAAWWGLNQLQQGVTIVIPKPTPSPSNAVTTNGTTNSPIDNPGAVSSFAQVKNVPEGNFRYGGSTTFAPIRDVVDREILKAVPNFKLIYLDPISEPPGSGAGIEMLINNQLSFSQSSRSLKPKEQAQAQDKKFHLHDIAVAFDGIAIAVNHQLTIPGLTITELKNIYTGKIKNWMEVGGPNLAIVPYSRSQKGGTVEFFQEQVLAKEPFGSNVKMVPDTTRGLRAVIANPGGIYYASAPEIVPQCGTRSLPLGRAQGQWVTPYQEPFVPPSNCPNQRNSLNQSAFQEATYPITRKIFVIVKMDGQIDEQAGIAYTNLLLTQQGQDLIKKAGFVSLK